MKLFLASRIESTIDLMIREFGIKPLKTYAVYVPTGQNCYVPKPEISERGSYNALIARKFKVSVCDLGSDTKTEMEDKFSSADIVVVGGGNTYFLLQQIISSGFGNMAKTLLKRGAIYAGSSAGSCVCSKTIDYIRNFDDIKMAPGLKSLEGLGLVDFEIYPHCIEEEYSKDYDPKKLKTILKTDSKKIFLRDSQAVVVKDGWYKIVSL